MIPTPIMPPRSYAKPQTNTAAGSAANDPEVFRYMLEQNMSKSLSSFFNSSDDSEDSNNNLSSLFSGSSNSSASSIFDSMQSNYSSSSIPSSSPAVELIAKSNLIGKTVTAIDPTSRQVFHGKVNSVYLENGSLMFDVGGNTIPAENLQSVSE